MPELSRFHGLVIQMYYADHAPPHFHVRHQAGAAQIGIDDLRLMGGSLPPRQMSRVVQWADMHRQELIDAWAAAQRLEQPNKIEPLP